MNKIISILLISLASLSFAQDSRPMNANEMLQASQQVKNAKTQKALTTWVESCSTQNWAKCHISWYEMTENGLTLLTYEDYESWAFVDQKDSNRVLSHMLYALNLNKYRSFWDLEVKYKGDSGAQIVVDAREALTNSAEQVMLLRAIEQQFAGRNVRFNARYEFKDPKMEWMRLLALSFAVRNDAKNSYAVLTELQNYVKMNKTDYDTYVHAHTAIVGYFKNGVTS